MGWRPYIFSAHGYCLKEDLIKSILKLLLGWLELVLHQRLLWIDMVLWGWFCLSCFASALTATYYWNIAINFAWRGPLGIIGSSILLKVADLEGFSDCFRHCTVRCLKFTRMEAFQALWLTPSNPWSLNLPFSLLNQNGSCCSLGLWALVVSLHVCESLPASVFPFTDWKAAPVSFPCWGWRSPASPAVPHASHAPPPFWCFSLVSLLFIRISSVSKVWKMSRLLEVQLWQWWLQVLSHGAAGCAFASAEQSALTSAQPHCWHTFHFLLTRLLLSCLRACLACQSQPGLQHGALCSCMWHFGFASKFMGVLLTHTFGLWVKGSTALPCTKKRDWLFR